MRRLTLGQELGGEEGQGELRGPSVVLPLLLPRQGCRKPRKEQVTERASLHVGHVQDVWENKVFRRHARLALPRPLEV